MAKYNFGSYTFYNPDVEEGKHEKWDLKKFDALIGNLQYREAYDYAKQFVENDPAKQRKREAELEILRRDANKHEAILNRVGKTGKDAFVFVNGVLKDGGFDHIEDQQNEYVDKYRTAKTNLGKQENDTSFNNLSITFKAKKQKGIFGLDWTAEDNEKYNYDTFLESTKLTEAYLKSQNVNVTHNEDGSTTVEFAKSNPLANTILFKTPVQTYHDDIKNISIGDYVMSAAMNQSGIPRIASEILFSPKHMSIKSYKVEDGKKVYNDSDISNDVYNMQTLLKDAEDKYNEAIEPIAGPKQYSSTVFSIPGYNEKAWVKEELIRKIWNGVEMYSNFINDADGDDTERLIEQGTEKNDLIKALMSSDAKNVQIYGKTVNGQLGTYFVITPTRKDNGDIQSIPGTNQTGAIRIFVPNLYTKDMQETLNSNTVLQASQELDAMQDYGYAYKTNKGELYATQGSFFLNGEELSKKEAINFINEDLIVKGASRELKYNFINDKNKITDWNALDRQVKFLAIHAAQELYPDVDLGYDLTNAKSVDDIFSKKGLGAVVKSSESDNLQHEAKNKYNKIFDIYQQIMDSLSYYRQ